jgi:signal transduction histidine kinase/ActR/RegA family two-component response regulator
MALPDDALFHADVWKGALEKYGAVTHLTVALYGADGQKVAGEPVPPTPLHSLFEEHRFDPGVFAECARRCLAQVQERPAVVVSPSYGLAVVGTSLVLDGTIVGAAVAGYAFVDFAEAPAVERLARQAGVPVRRLWEVARHQEPVPARRLVLNGELLQVLGDAILRENHRTRQYEETAARLTREMAAKDEFLAVFGHELRNPLSPATTALHVMKLHGEGSRELGIVERQVAHMTRLVEDLLDVSRITRGKIDLKKERVELHEVVSRAVELAEPALAQGEDVLVVRVPRSGMAIDADAGRLAQVFSNLLINAAKYSRARSSITVSAERDTDKIRVSVSDQGKGLAPEMLERVFDIFVQERQSLDRARGGLGLGLAVVRSIVGLHGGTVWARSAGVGHGSVFTVELPAAPPEAAKGPETAGPELAEKEPTAEQDRRRVLVVDDNEDAREAMAALVESQGHTVAVAHDGPSALEVAERFAPEIALVDIGLPAMDGYELAVRLRALVTNVRLIAVTGYGQESDKRRAKEAGFEHHLVKPFQVEKLARLLVSPAAPSEEPRAGRE